MHLIRLLVSLFHNLLKKNKTHTTDEIHRAVFILFQKEGSKAYFSPTYSHKQHMYTRVSPKYAIYKYIYKSTYIHTYLINGSHASRPAAYCLAYVGQTCPLRPARVSRVCMCNLGCITCMHVQRSMYLNVRVHRYI